MNSSHKPAWSRLGLGTGTLASLGRAATLSEVNRLISTMFEIGMTVIDTADSYGSGDCECLLGKALLGKRGQVVLVSKAGYRLSHLKGPLRPINQLVKKVLHRVGKRQLFEPSYLSLCLDRSLSRLRVEQLDAFLLHDPPLEVLTDERVIRLCEDLKQSGKTIFTGVSSADPDVLRSAISSGAFEVIQTPANLNAAATMQPIWQVCEANQIHLIGNHVFDPACLSHRGMTHEKLMRASAWLLPSHFTILCGSRNPIHLRQSNQWATESLAECDLSS